jgi:hypothetical protein
VTPYERVFFFLAVLAALFPASAGLFAPKRLDRAFSWASVPPLHARFIGSIYLFALLYTLGSLFARHRWQIGSTFWSIAIFTGIIGYLNTVNSEAFDFDRITVQAWTGVYLVFPVICVALALRARGHDDGPAPGGVIPGWARTVFLGQAAVYAVVGVLLLVARTTMADAWPWPVSAGLVQFYGGASVALAYISWHSARRRTWPELGLVVPPFAVFGMATIVVSVVHWDLFSAGDLATWVWFGFFGAVTTAFLAMVAVMLQSGRAAVRAHDQLEAGGSSGGAPRSPAVDGDLERRADLTRG